MALNLRDRNEITFSELWVCFTPPAEEPGASTLVLSFMPPGVEAQMEARCGAQLIRGRELISGVRARARSEYVRLVARLGTTPVFRGRTFRAGLRGRGAYSRWWFLDLTEKDCLWDKDLLFLTLLQGMAIREAKERFGIQNARWFGAPRRLEYAFRQRTESVWAIVADGVHAVARGLLSRVTLAREYLGLWWTLRQMPRPAGEYRDVLLQACWDWTVRTLPDGRVHDRYFTDLPARLRSLGVQVGWLASCEVSQEPWQRDRNRRAAIAAASARADVVLLEQYLTPLDILRTCLNLRDPILVSGGVLTRVFRTSCMTAGLDLYPLVRTQLTRAVWGGTFCRLQLVALGVARACSQLKPRMLLGLFELFLRSRAFYAGARSSLRPVATWAAQHAGYSSDKTLGVFDPSVEVGGEPDGCPIPAPDGIFVLGELSRRIWEGNGFPPERVIVTGGLRYQAVKVESRNERPHGDRISVLLAGGMCDAAHVDLCEAAIAAATGLPVAITYRDHPSYLFSKRASFGRFGDAITVASGSLDENLQEADLVLYSQTGIAEEALIRGIPTWQWLWPGFNTSPFLDIPVIPAFSSAPALRQALIAFIRDPEAYRPKVEHQRRVLYECFGPDPPNVATRIAESIQRMLGKEQVARA